MRQAKLVSEVYTGLRGVDLRSVSMPHNKAETLEAVVELDLTDLAGLEPPRGYGRD